MSHAAKNLLPDSNFPEEPLLQKRRPKVLAAFRQCEAHWSAWERLITEAPFQFFKLDGTEVRDLDPELFQLQLPPAIRWFSSGSPDDFAKLLSIAKIPMIQPRGFLGRILGSRSSGYDVATKTLTIAKGGAGRSDSVGHHLHGYAWVREVPWKDE